MEVNHNTKGFYKAKQTGELRDHVGLDTIKPVFGVSEKARLKPVSLATDTS